MADRFQIARDDNVAVNACHVYSADIGCLRRDHMRMADVRCNRDAFNLEFGSVDLCIRFDILRLVLDFHITVCRDTSGSRDCRGRRGVHCCICRVVFERSCFHTACRRSNFNVRLAVPGVRYGDAASRFYTAAALKDCSEVTLCAGSADHCADTDQ